MRQSNTRMVAEIKFGPTTWWVESSCGVVKVRSSNLGCMVAMSPDEARYFGVSIAEAMVEAADSVDSAVAGGPR